MSLPIVKVDEDYQHDSLDWSYRLRIKKLKRGATAVRERYLRISDIEQLIALSASEHADCFAEGCEVREVLGRLGRD